MLGSLPRKRKASEQVVPGIDDAHGSAVLRRRTSHESTHSNPTNPYDEPDYPIPDFKRIYNLMRHPTNGLQLADRRWRFCTYPQCFVGKEAVQWIVDNLKVDTEGAVSIGQRLMDAGIIHHVTKSEPFCDGHYFYRFQEDDDSTILNMKRVWDRSLPTRDAVQVAKNLLTTLALLCEEHRKKVLAAKKTTDPSPSTPRLSDPSSAQKSSSPPSTPNFAQQVLAAAISPFVPTIANHVAALTSPQISSAALPLLTASAGDDVDYSALAKSEKFRQYTISAGELQCVQLVALDDFERTAFFANVYNALCLHAHVVHGPPDTMARRWVFFRNLSYRVAGLDMTLDDIEHGILRGNKKPPMLRFVQQWSRSDPKCELMLKKRDGRIHFVISAGTSSDPPIRILDGENVEEQLHDATSEFLSYSVKVDVDKRTVTLPRILMWYAEDFVTPEKNLLLWVAKYLTSLSPKISNQLVALAMDDQNPPSVSYENFDWSNAQARFKAAEVRRKRQRLERETARFEGGIMPTPGIDMSFLMPITGLQEPFSPNFMQQSARPDQNNSPIAMNNTNMPQHVGSLQTERFSMALEPAQNSNVPQQQTDVESVPVKSGDLLYSVEAETASLTALTGNNANKNV